MQSYKNLEKKILQASVKNKLDEQIADLNKNKDFDEHQLDCLLNPENYAPVIRIGECTCSDEEKKQCKISCEFDAFTEDENGNKVISEEDCVGCEACIRECKLNRLVERKEFVPVFNLLNLDKTPVYAMIAPAYISQFSEDVTPGKLRSAFKQLGFAGMIEVALFADILTLKEALEFDNSIHNDKDFMLTSCCCPMWIGMIKKVYSTLVPHLPPSVSPMVACGRSIKILHPDAKTVFVGPCVAKKAEARDRDVADAVDYVLTFQEMKDIFETAKIEPSTYEEDLRDHSSTAGRIYARTAGVSEAVQNTLNRLRPDREIALKARQADGVPACKQMLKDIKEGNINANFIEGMGCVGGCVGGPKSILNKEESKKHVNEYGNQATSKTPVDNAYVLELLERLGFDTIESLLKDKNIFTRDFNV